MACGACGNKSRRPMRSGAAGKSVNQTQPSRGSAASTKDRGRSRLSGLRWNSK